MKNPGHGERNGKLPIALKGTGKRMTFAGSVFRVCVCDSDLLSITVEGNSPCHYVSFLQAKQMKAIGGLSKYSEPGVLARCLL